MLSAVMNHAILITVLFDLLCCDDVHNCLCISRQVVEMLLDSPLTRQLIDGSPSDDTLDNERTTCLHLAARNGHVDIIRLVL